MLFAYLTLKIKRNSLVEAFGDVFNFRRVTNDSHFGDNRIEHRGDVFGADFGQVGNLNLGDLRHQLPKKNNGKRK